MPANTAAAGSEAQTAQCWGLLQRTLVSRHRRLILGPFIFFRVEQNFYCEGQHQSRLFYLSFVGVSTTQVEKRGSTSILSEFRSLSSAVISSRGYWLTKTGSLITKHQSKILKYGCWAMASSYISLCSPLLGKSLLVGWEDCGKVLFSIDNCLESSLCLRMRYGYCHSKKMPSLMCSCQTVDPKKVKHITWTAQRTPASAMNL